MNVLAAKSVGPKVYLAPMSGITDAPFRRACVRAGSANVISEMVAGDALESRSQNAALRLARHDGSEDFVVQIIGRQADHMTYATRAAIKSGATRIDINMGCPARKVTGGCSGSALMRDLPMAGALIEAVLDVAGDMPVSLKMRLGWDRDSLNAPELAAIAEGLGVRAFTVHGRTRNQFYKGEADWSAVRETVNAVNLPVTVNGDISGIDTARSALAKSGAQAVMIGRAAIGKPWLCGAVETALATSEDVVEPSVHEQAEGILDLIADSIVFYGEALGTRTVRKHVSEAIDGWASRTADSRTAEDWRSIKARACTANSYDGFREAFETFLNCRSLAA